MFTFHYFFKLKCFLWYVLFLDVKMKIGLLMWDLSSIQPWPFCGVYHFFSLLSSQLGSFQVLHCNTNISEFSYKYEIKYCKLGFVSENVNERRGLSLRTGLSIFLSLKVILFLCNCDLNVLLDGFKENSLCVFCIKLKWFYLHVISYCF